MVVVEVGVWAGEVFGGQGGVEDCRKNANERQPEADLVDAPEEEGDGSEGGDGCWGHCVGVVVKLVAWKCKGDV